MDSCPRPAQFLKGKTKTSSGDAASGNPFCQKRQQTVRVSQHSPQTGQTPAGLVGMVLWCGTVVGFGRLPNTPDCLATLSDLDAWLRSNGVPVCLQPTFGIV